MEILELSQATQWLVNHGLSLQMLEILLMIPVIATIVSIARYIVGLKTFGIYSAIILGISYSFTGLKYGLAITLVVVTATLLSHKILSRIRMHYITKIAINYCILTVAIMGLFILVNRFGLGLQNIWSISPLAVVSIAALSDFFIKLYVKKSFKDTFRSFAETLLIAILGWFLLTTNSVTTFLLNNIWIIPVLIVVNLSIGQFKGLRLVDNFRFKSILQKKDDRTSQNQ
jgi:hypothetical protein